MPQEVRRRSPEAEPPGDRPGHTAVGRLALHDRERRDTGGSKPRGVMILNPDRGHEPARRQLHDVRLVIVRRGGPRGHGDLPDQPPGVATVARPGHGQLAEPHVVPGAERLADIEEIAIGEPDRAVWRGDGRPHRLAPGRAAVVGPHHPRPHELLDHLVGPVCEDLLPCLPLGGRNPSFVGIHPRVAAKPRYEQRIAAEVRDAAIAVVDRRVLDHTRLRPRAAVIAALVEHGLAERADVLAPQAGTHDDEPAIVEAGDRGPAEVAEPLVRNPTDHAVLGLEPAGRGLLRPRIVGQDRGEGDEGRGRGVPVSPTRQCNTITHGTAPRGCTRTADADRQSTDSRGVVPRTRGRRPRRLPGSPLPRSPSRQRGDDASRLQAGFWARCPAQPNNPNEAWDRRPLPGSAAAGERREVGEQVRHLLGLERFEQALGHHGDAGVVGQGDLAGGDADVGRVGLADHDRVGVT